MLIQLLRKYKIMILLGVFFFYFGCFFTISFIRIDCANTVPNKTLLGLPAETFEYVVLVISGPKNEGRRVAIRETWAKFTSNVYVKNNAKFYKWSSTLTRFRIQDNIFKIYFAIGMQNLDEKTKYKLKSEQSKSGDLLFLDDLEDSYQNLSAKIILALKWINETVKGLKFVIKCDDDSFVRIDLIVKDLEAYAPGMNDPDLDTFVSFKKTLPSYKGLYWGYFNGQAKVYFTGKWEENDWFLCDKYLPYALGGGYVISQSIVDYISKNADILSLYNSEDVSMGVWTSPLKDINRVHDIRFDTEWKSRGCSKDMLVRHKQSPADMFELYNTLIQTDGKSICKTDYTERSSYIYNWKGLPSQCCKNS